MNKCEIVLLSNPYNKATADLKKFLKDTIYKIKNVDATNFKTLKHSLSNAHILFALDPNSTIDTRNITVAQTLNLRVYIIADPRKLNWLMESPNIIIIPKTGYQLKLLLGYFEEELYGENPFM